MKLTRIPQKAETQMPSDIAVHELELGGTRYRVISMPTLQPPALNALTSAEQAVLQLILRGLGNADIAAARNSAERTVANQVRAILAKLGCSSRTQLAAQFGSQLAASSAPDGNLRK